MCGPCRFVKKFKPILWAFFLCFVSSQHLLWVPSWEFNFNRGKKWLFSFKMTQFLPIMGEFFANFAPMMSVFLEICRRKHLHLRPYSIPRANYPSIHPPIHPLFIHLHIHPFIHYIIFINFVLPSIYLTMHPAIHLHIHSSIHPSTYLPIDPPIKLVSHFPSLSLLFFIIMNICNAKYGIKLNQVFSIFSTV